MAGDMALAHTSRASGRHGASASMSTEMLDRALSAFTDAIHSLPFVEQILAETETALPKVWTVISAPPFDPSYRQPIFEAQSMILQDPHNPLVGFRLVNIQELEHDLITVLPASYRTLYRRQAQE